MSGEMIPVPTVCATCSPKNRKAMKLKNAAQTTATFGDSTRVETTVAIELAASCRPLRKSKMRATAMRAASSTNESAIAKRPPGSRRSDVLDHDALNLVGDVIKLSTVSSRCL